MTMHSAWNGPTSDDFAAIEKLRARHSTLMQRRPRRADADDEARSGAERAARYAADLAESRDVRVGRGSSRGTVFAVGAGLAAAVALGTAGFWSVGRHQQATVERIAPATVSKSNAGPDTAARRKLADAMRAAPAFPESARALRSADPQPPAPPPPLISDEDLTNLREKAAGLITDGQIAGARALLERAARVNDAAALFALAQTFDLQALQRWKTVGIVGDAFHAKDLYRRAADAGSVEAKQRLAEMER